MGLRTVLCLSLALAACSGDSTDDSATIPEPGEFMAGSATLRIPAPVGIGCPGYSPFDVPESVSPFADIYPATTRLHGHPQVRVGVVSRGEPYELVFVRIDSVGVFQQIRRALVLEIQDRLGRDLDDSLIIGATHTHSGPGRVVDAGGFFDLIADSFFPEFYERFVDSIASAIELAYEDLAPAQVAWTFANCDDAHDDRRCEDGLDYQNGAMPLVAVQRDGQVDGLIMSYAIHGTVLNIDDLTLSQDVSGAIEQAVEDRFDHPVQVIFFNSWGADMSPGSPDVEAGEGAEQPDGYDQMEQIGLAVADAVEQELDSFEFQSEPDIRASTYRIPIDRDAIGYDDGDFDYDYGAVYCGMNYEADCDPETTSDDLDESCISFTEEYPAPDQTLFTVGNLGDLFLVTFTGEPGTLLAEQIIDGATAHDGVDDVMFLGYTQDYLGYSILEDDWWQGGYEASGALWGPRQGEYLADMTALGIDDYLGTGTFGSQASAVDPFDDPVYTPYEPTTALDSGSVLQDVDPTYAPTDVVEFAIAGEDPWLGTPIAYLESSDGTPVLRDGGSPVTSDGYRFWVDLEPDPPYEDDATQRTFRWQFNMPVQHVYSMGGPVLQGQYRLRVEIPQQDGSIIEATSSTFTVER